MKQPKLLFVWMAIFLLVGLTSCSEEDKRVFGDDFEIPELTDANTIQFTVDATTEWKILEICAGGGRRAIEWGDGRIQKIENAKNAVTSYRYGNAKKYHVRVWAEELDYCRIGDNLIPISNLQMGNFPNMRDLALGAFTDTRELDLSTSCPNLYTLQVGSMPDLEHLEFNACLELEDLSIFSVPKITSLTVTNLPHLRRFMYGSDGVRTLSLKGVPELHTVECLHCDDLSGLEVDDNNIINTLSIINCAFSSVPFLTKMPNLTSFYCRMNQLTHLDMSENSKLGILDCSNNLLENLSLPLGNGLSKLECHNNRLSASILDNIFAILNDATSVPANKKPQISFYDNSGAASCNKHIFIDKGWIEISKTGKN